MTDIIEVTVDSSDVIVESGVQGIPGTQILEGNRDPIASDGNLADYWLNRSARTIYGPKAVDGWPTEGMSLADTPAEKLPTPRVANAWVLGGDVIAADGYSTLDPIDGVAERLRVGFGLSPGRFRNLAHLNAEVRYNAAAASYAKILTTINVGVRAWPHTPQVGVAVLAYGIEDAKRGGTTGTWQERSFKNAMKATINRLMSGTTSLLNSDATSTGAWTMSPWSGAPGGSAGVSYSTVSVGATLTIPVTSTPTGHPIDLTFIGGKSGATATIRVDGTLHGTVTTGGMVVDHNDPDTGAALDTSSWAVPVPYTISGLDPTVNHTILVTVTAVDAGAQFHYDSWSRRSKPDPLVLVCDLVTPRVSHPAHPYVATYNGWIADVVTSYASAAVRRVGLSDADQSNWLIPGDNRPNAAGAAQIAGLIINEYKRAFINGVTADQALYRWADETDTIRTPELLRANGTSLEVVDLFNRLDNRGDLAQHEWTPINGEFGVVNHDAYVSSDGIRLPLHISDFTADANANYSSLNSSFNVQGGSFNYVKHLGGTSGLQASVTSGADSARAIIGTQGLDHYVRFQLLNPYVGIGALLRYVDNDNYLVAQINTGGDVQLLKKVAGTLTSVGHFTDIYAISPAVTGVTPPNPHVVVTVQGDQVRCFRDNYANFVASTASNGSIANGAYTITDAALRTGILVGLKTTTTTPDVAWGGFSTGAFSDLAANRNFAMRDIGRSRASISFVIDQAFAPGTGVAFKAIDQFQYLRFYATAINTWSLASSVMTPGSYGLPASATETVIQGGITGPTTVGTTVGLVYGADSVQVYFNGISVGAAIALSGPVVTLLDVPSATRVALTTARTGGVTPGRLTKFYGGDVGAFGSFGALDGDFLINDHDGHLYGPFANGTWSDSPPVNVDVDRHILATGAHQGASIAYAPNGLLLSTDVQAALDEITTWATSQLYVETHRGPRVVAEWATPGAAAPGPAVFSMAHNSNHDWTAFTLSGANLKSGHRYRIEANLHSIWMSWTTGFDIFPVHAQIWDSNGLFVAQDGCLSSDTTHASFHPHATWKQVFDDTVDYVVKFVNPAAGSTYSCGYDGVSFGPPYPTFQLLDYGLDSPRVGFDGRPPAGAFTSWL
jgi:hypothetical protein